MTMEEKKIKAPKGGIITAVGAALLFGTESVAVQLGYAGGFNLITLATFRFFLGVLVFLAVLIITKSLPMVERKFRSRVLLLAFLRLANSLLLYASLMFLPAALAILFFYSYPSFTAIFSRVIFKNPMSRITLYSLIVSAIGLALLYSSSLAGLSVLGVVFAILSAVFNALNMNLASTVFPYVNLYTYSFNVNVLVLAGYVIVSLLDIWGGFTLHGINPDGWLSAVYLGIFVSACASFLMSRGIKLINPVNTSLIMLLEPPCAALLALLFFNDVLTLPQMLGGIIILLAVALPLIKNRRGKSQEIAVGEKNAF